MDAMVRPKPIRQEFVSCTEMPSMLTSEERSALQISALWLVYLSLQSLHFVRSVLSEFTH